MNGESQGRSVTKGTGDALIDEVRTIRRQMCAQCGNDVDRLIEHLREVESDYTARRGVFSGVSKEAAERVVATWGEEALRSNDPLLDEVRAIRRQLGEEGSKS
jgi:hypothetical protein